jgi:hypothetical protein
MFLRRHSTNRRHLLRHLSKLHPLLLQKQLPKLHPLLLQSNPLRHLLLQKQPLPLLLLLLQPLPLLLQPLLRPPTNRALGGARLLPNPQYQRLL